MSQGATTAAAALAAWADRKIIYSAALSGGRRIVFGVYSDGGVWLRFIRPGFDLSFSLTPEAWKLVRSLPENGINHYFALAG